jgi:hypothetical protein
MEYFVLVKMEYFMDNIVFLKISNVFPMCVLPQKKSEPQRAYTEGTYTNNSE